MGRKDPRFVDSRPQYLAYGIGLFRGDYLLMFPDVPLDGRLNRGFHGKPDDGEGKHERQQEG
jgi:hypothetical protein